MDPLLAAIIGPTFDKVVAVVFVVGILATAYQKVISPFANFITTVNEKVVPNVKYMPDLPKINKVLSVVEAIAAQFQRDDGSSLKDDMDVLAEHAMENRAAAAEAKQAALEAQQAVTEARAAAVEFAHTNAAGIATLEVLVGTIKERADDDRQLARNDRDLARDSLEKIRDIMASATRTEASGVRTEASGERVEASGVRTEASGERIEADRASVAVDLAAAQKRADDVHEDEEPGTAADAASQSAE